MLGLDNCSYQSIKVTVVRAPEFESQTQFKLECTVDGSPSQIPTLCANVANSMMNRRMDEWTDSYTLSMRGSHVASLVKFHSVLGR